MRYVLFLLVAIPSLAMVTANAMAQPLWQGSAYGMTVEQVVRITPGTTRTTKPESLGNGASELLHLDGIKIGSYAFRARYFFLSEKLDQVTLTLQGSYTGIEARGVYDSITDALRGKYGHEISTKNLENSLGIRACHQLSQMTAATRWMAARKFCEVLS